jgi:diguanylate cyclase (GGDEF)-like protein
MIFRGLGPRLSPWLGCLLSWLLTLSPAPVLAWGIGTGGPTHALTQYKIDGWQTEQGLPLNTVQSLLQTRDGYLWVGTAGGLARFDGVRFTSYESSAIPEVSSRPIFGLMEDALGRLWVGHSKGAAIYHKGQFAAAFPAEVTAGKRAWDFAQSGDGVVWAATENGLVRWENGATRLYQQADGLPTNRLRALAFDREGTLWIATTGGGLVSFAAGRFEVLNPKNGFPHLEVRSVLADPEGGVWAATAGGGLAHVGKGQIRTYTVADGLPTDQLTNLARDAQGALWIGTWGGGVSRLSAGRFTSLSTSAGLAGDQIWPLLVDREGSVWIGTWSGGLNRLRSRTFGVLGAPEGLSNDNIRSVLHGRNGVTWVSTAGGGLNRIEGDRITTITTRQGLPTNEISSLLEDRDGALWIGSYTGGVTRLRQGRIESFSTGQGLPHVDVRALYQDRSGTLWAGTRSGLARFTGQGFVPVRDPGAPLEGVITILQDRSGTLWFGTTGQGLVSLRQGKFSTLTMADGLVSNWILALHEDASAGLWIGTNGEGMNRLRDGKLTAIRTTDGLWDGISQTILEDGQGFFWMTCNRGFYRVARADLDAFAEGRVKKVTSTGFGAGYALRSMTFAGGHQPAGAIDRQGQLWLPSSRGLVIVDPAHLPVAAAPPTVRVEEVLATGAVSATDSELVLPPGSVPVRIRFTAMTLNNSERVRFRYQMEGVTRDWVDVGLSREASFPALPHGSYRFRVSASTDAAQWSEAPEALSITVQAHFWQTSWFLALCLGAGLAGISGLFRWRTHQLHTRQLEMEHLVAKRTEELKLANEHLARLSFVDALTGLANRRCFDETLEKEWRRAARLKIPLAVVMADVDNFKLYNDALGHPEGDRCLAAVADVFLKSVGRAGDLAARYGGEEFVVLIPGADQAAALAVAEALRASCAARAMPHPAPSVGPIVTISLGVASCIPSDETSAASLVALADAALYRAKQDGRNRVR